MVSEKICIVNPTGFQMLIAEQICNLAKEYESEILFLKDNSITNAKSILSILGSGIHLKDEIEVRCHGCDEKQALADVLKLLKIWNQ